jgi:hypothetical protein
MDFDWFHDEKILKPRVYPPNKIRTGIPHYTATRQYVTLADTLTKIEYHHVQDLATGEWSVAMANKLPIFWKDDSTAYQIEVTGEYFFPTSIAPKTQIYIWHLKNNNRYPILLPEQRVWGLIRSIASLADGSLLVSGRFSRVGDSLCNNIFIFDNGQILPVGEGLSAPIFYNMAPLGSKFVVGGNFRDAPGGVFSPNLAVWDPHTDSFTPILPNLRGGSVRKVLPHGDYLYVSGNFSNVGELNVYGLARYRFSDQSWEIIDTSGINKDLRFVGDMEIVGDTLFVIFSSRLYTYRLPDLTPLTLFPNSTSTDNSVGLYSGTQPTHLYRHQNKLW